MMFSLFMLLITCALTATFSLVFPPVGHGLIVLMCAIYMWTEKTSFRNIYLFWAIMIGQVVALLVTLFAGEKISISTQIYFGTTTSVAWLIGTIIAGPIWKRCSKNEHRPAT